jgi:hypothetical protein
MGIPRASSDRACSAQPEGCAGTPADPIITRRVASVAALRRLWVRRHPRAQKHPALDDHERVGPHGVVGGMGKGKG